MKRLTSSLKNMVLSLTLIALVAAALLALINSVTEKPIQNIKEKNQSDGIKSVLGIAADEEVTVKETTQDDYLLFSVTRADGSYAGTAVRSTDKAGFGGDIVVLVGFADNGQILGYQVMEHAETPGLGARAGDWFRTATATTEKKIGGVSKAIFGNPDPAGNHNIVGMDPAKDKLTVSKDGGDVDAITASTITSRAFLRAVQNAYNVFKGQQADAATSATAPHQ